MSDINTPKRLWSEVCDTYTQHGAALFLLHLLLVIVASSIFYPLYVPLLLIGEGVARVTGANK